MAFSKQKQPKNNKITPAQNYNTTNITFDYIFSVSEFTFP